MASKPIGEFSLKMITQTNTPGPAGSVLIQVNFEMQISDGRRLASAGEIDLAARTWKGTLSEIG